MTLSGLFFVFRAVSLFLWAACVVRSADTSDYAMRNETFAGPAAVQPDDAKAKLATKFIATPAPRSSRLQAVASTPAADRTAALRVVETRPKAMLAPAAQPLGGRVVRDFSRQTPVRYPAGGALRPVPLVGKYQERLSTVNRVHIGRTPVLRRNSTEQLNRFVFHRGGDASAIASDSSRLATPAGGDRSPGER